MASKRENYSVRLLKCNPKQVRATLGDALWADFVAHANACYTDAFLSAVPKPVLRCVGPPHGVEGPHKFSGNLTCARAYLYATLGELHLDHEQDLVVTCDMWVQALAALATWDDGVDGAFIGARRPGGRGGDGPMLHNTNYSRTRPEPHTRRCRPSSAYPVTACALKFVDNLLAYPKGTIFCCWRSVCRVREMIAFLKWT
jgi:hypothetical protein